MTMQKTKKRKMTPIRFKALRNDASIEAAHSIIENTFRLPIGSVKLVHPSGRKVRADGTVGSLLKSWDANE